MNLEPARQALHAEAVTQEVKGRCSGSHIIIFLNPEIIICITNI